MNRGKRNSWMAFVAAVIAAGIMGGCSGSGAVQQPPPPAISVAVSPNAAQTIDQGQTKTFTATVSNDSSNKGVSWTLTQNGTSCSPGCGTIAPTNTASGAAATYTAPAAINANVQFNVIAKSVADTTKSGAVQVTAVPPPALSNPAQLPPATAGQPYSYQLTETGGVPPYTWSIASGSLPPGLSLNSSTGVISGTPTASAVHATSLHAMTSGTPAPVTYTFTVQVVDSGTPALSAQMQASMTATPLALTITTTSPLPSGLIGTAYSQALAASGGTGTYTWSITGGSLPAGLNLNASSGAITGTPTGPAGTANFSVQVTDSAAPIPQTASSSFVLQIVAPLSISTSALASGIIGSAYNQTLAATGGTTPYTWSITAGSLPAGLTLNASSGTITGTPTGPAGTANFTVQVKDSGTPAQTKTQALSITVMAATVQLQITTPALPNGADARGSSYSAALQATGGVPPYTWSAAGLPPALSIDSNTGTISGNTTRGGMFPVKVTVKDSAGTQATDSKNYTLTIPCLVNTPGVVGLPANWNADLTGPFAFRFSGFDASGHAVARVGGFIADGNAVATTNNGFGRLTGEEDVAVGSAGGASFQNQQFDATKSSYCIGNDERNQHKGTLTLVTATASVTYDITVAPANLFNSASASMIEFDPVDNAHGAGILAQQASSLSILPGNYVFGLTGRDSGNGPASVAGVFNIGASLAGTAGEDDFNDPAASLTVVNNNPIAATFSGQPDPNGRTTGKLTAGSNTTATGDIDFVAYAVHPFEFFVLSNGSGPLPLTDVPVLSGEIFWQNASLHLDASDLNGTSLFYLAGVDPSSPLSNQAATVGIIGFNGNGNQAGANGLITTLELDADIGGTITGPVNATSGTYTVSSDGRALFNPPPSVNFSPIAYLSGADSGVLLDASPGAGLGRFFKPLVLASQPVTDGIIDDLPPTVRNSVVATGEVFTTGSSSLGWIQDSDSPTSGLTFGHLSSGSLPFSALDSLRRFTVGSCPPTLPGAICLVGYGPTAGGTEILIDETNPSAGNPVVSLWGSVPINPAPSAPMFLTLATTTFKEGTSGLFRVAASGFPAPTLSIISINGITPGTLPSGVTFNPSTGTLSGTPATGTAGSYVIKFQASNLLGSAIQDFTLNVNASSATLAISTTSLPAASVNAMYSATVSATGGNSPYTWKETTITPLFDAAGNGRSGACVGLKLNFPSPSSLRLPC